MTEIKNIGCQCVEPKSFVLDIPSGLDYLFILTHTPALFWVNGEITEYPAYSAVLFHPNQRVYYRASGGNFINDWIRFSTTESYITATSLPRGIPFPMKDPEYCSKLIQLIFSEIFLNNEKDSYRELSIDYLMMVLMNKLKESYYSCNTTPRHHELLKLRKQILNNPNHNWTVEKMADYLHVSAGYLQALYKNAFGISCMDDVINGRIRMAKEYLIQSTYSIAEIATMCGYNNVEHFCRQFKKVSGCTPGEFRSKIESSVQKEAL